MAESDIKFLSNKELHAKRKEHGLANVPVTDSSRSVLIQNLLEVMREPSTSTGAKPKRSNQRVTLNVLEPTQHINAPLTQQSLSARRATSVSIEKQSPHVLPPSKHQYVALSKGGLTKTSFTLEAGDSDRSPVRVQRVSETDSDTESIPRSNRSVSLSRSEVVTTSYVQERVPLKPHPKEAVETTVHSRSSPSSLYPNLYEDPSLDLAKSVQSHMDNGAPHFDAKLNRFVSSNNAVPRNRFTATGIGRPFSALDEFRPLSVNFTANNGLQGRTISRKYMENLENPIRDQSDSDETGDDECDLDKLELSSDSTDSEMGSIDPKGGYTSGFARDLERKKRLGTMSSSSPTVGAPRPPIERKENGDVPLRDIMTTLERKYHLKQSFAIILCFLTAAFVYVFFVQ